MKKNVIFIILIINAFALTFCKTSVNNSEVIVYKDYIKLKSNSKLTINLVKGKAYNHPSFVIWQEDLEGNYQKTYFITKSYASGIFEFQMQSDSIWLNKKGESYQPAALPYWTYKKGLINNKTFVPTKENPFVDAYSGATPKNNFVFETLNISKIKKYRILLEVNQTWDWNKFWNNSKFPNNNAYKHSAQPSVIYAVTINEKDSVYLLNPIGHGNPTGENGNLYTNLSTLCSAKEIFNSIKIEIK